MSAGGLSYSCLTTNRKATLPSVEMWGTNMNILADPYKSVFTRRIDKVGDTQGILLSQEASGDRVAECINVYARGVNPMVSVSYDNYGNNAGSKSTAGVKLPLRPEVFYPPVFRQEDLMPLSRQPRNWFYALTNPLATPIFENRVCPDQKSGVHEVVLHPSASTNLEYTLQEIPRNQPDVAHTIQQNTRTADRVACTVPIHDRAAASSVPSDYQITDGLHASAQTSVSLPRADVAIRQDTSGRVRENRLLYSALSAVAGRKHTPTPTVDQNRAIREATLSAEVSTNPAREGPSSGIEGYSSQTRDDVLAVSAPARPSLPFRSIEAGGFVDAKTREALRTEPVLSASGGYTVDGRPETRSTAVREEGGMGTFVVSTGSFPSRAASSSPENRPSQASAARPDVRADARPIPVYSGRVDVGEPVVARREILHTQAETRPSAPALQRISGPESLARAPRRTIPSYSASSGISGPVVSDPYHAPASSSLREAFRVEGRANPVEQDHLAGLDVFAASTTRSAIGESRTPVSVSGIRGGHERAGELGEVRAGERSTPLVQDLETVHDRTSFGTEFYQRVQSVDGAAHTGHRPVSLASFEARGSSVPRFDRPAAGGGERTNPFMSVKRNAVAQFMDRWQGNP
ncbi:hypothetical protein EBZ80_02275 [bacterium]|nr:hypothetical protein [bacterium]